MSMSQEEIESLMNGLDISEEPEEDIVEPTSSEVVNPDEIDELISQTQDSNEPVSNDDIDALLKGFEDDNNTSSDSNVEEKIEEDNFDDILASIEGMVDSSEPEKEDLKSEKIEENLKPEIEETPILEPVVPNNTSKKEDKDRDEIGKNWADSKINEGVFPLPADKDAKVVNQLTQVANDSEEKVSQIFDVLSLALDNNNEIRKKINDINSFIGKETKLLSSLNNKFPNIDVFDEHLQNASKISEQLKELNSSLNEEDGKIFEAMELMQFNDINRQKIERVMSVIRRLSSYLNNLFEDDAASSEIVVAKHIHGDDNDDLIGDDLDKLIAEFAK